MTIAVLSGPARCESQDSQVLPDPITYPPRQVPVVSSRFGAVTDEHAEMATEVTIRTA